MLGRLFFGIHWILFVAFVGLWCLFGLAIVLGDTDRLLRNLGRMIEFREGLVDFLAGSAMTWIPPVFFFIDYVVHGKWTWFPWQRNKN